MSRNPEVTRFWKYVFLATVGAVFTFVVFNAFSFYAARRDLDNELKSASIPSLEWLYQVQRNNNALAIASLETRCTERMQLAAFRLLQSDDAGLLIDAYDRQFNARIALIQLLSSGAGVIDTRKALTYFDNLQSNVLYIDSYLAPAAGVSISSEAYLEFRRKVIDWQKQYRIIQADLQSAKDVATDAKYKAIFNNTNNAIQALESRLARISATTIKLDDTQREVFMRYSMWTESLIGSIPVQLLNEYSTAPNAKSNELL